jgi:hypothetical protein
MTAKKPSKTVVFECPDCQKLFKTREAWNTHAENSECLITEVEAWQCNHCSELFESPEQAVKCCNGSPEEVTLED